MVSQEQAEKYVEALSELIQENAETNNQLVKKTYADSMDHAKRSIERRIANGEFPTLARLREKFGVAASE
jgi:hypothetical protein